MSVPPERHGDRNSLKYVAIAAALVVGVALFVGGVGFGFWFSTNFQIVPKGDLNKVIQQALGDQAGGTGEVDVQGLVNQVLQSAQVAEPESGVGGAANAEKGPFTFKFTPGEKLQYRLSANVTGKGLELLSPEPVDMKLDSAFHLTTQAVDSEGNATVEMSYDQTRMGGNFMGSAIEMAQGPEGSKLSIGGLALVDSSRGQNAGAGLPQFAFFEKAVTMEIAPNGQVTGLSGNPELAAMMQSPLLTNIEFPSGHIDVGTQWETPMYLPIPGMDKPLQARIVNTFTGYRTIGPRLCAVIEQDISAAGSGTMTGLPGAPGEASTVSVPQMDLAGKNTVYFDTENGQLVHSEMDLDLGLDLSQAIGGPGGKFLGEVTKSLGNLLSDLPEFEHLKPDPNAPAQSNPLKLDLDINAAVSLTDPVAPTETIK